MADPTPQVLIRAHGPRTAVLRGASRAAALLAALCAASEAYAATLYVDNTTTDCAGPASSKYDPANDTCGSGTFQVYGSFQGAFDAMLAGDHVVVADGVYTASSGDYFGTIRKGGTEQKWITIRAENKWGAILDGEFERFSAFAMAQNETIGYISFEGLEIKNNRWTAINFNHSAGNYQHHMRIRQCKIHHMGQKCNNAASGITGFGSGRDGRDFEFDSNVIHTIGRALCAECPGQSCTLDSWDHGLYLSGDRMTIVNNVFYDIPGGLAIQFYDGSSGAERSTGHVIMNNTFADPRVGGARGHIVFGNPGVKDTLIQNNIFFNPNLAMVTVSSANCTHVGANVRFLHNLTTAPKVMESPCDYASDGNIFNTDPGLVDPPSRNYHLLPGSAAVDKGHGANMPPSYDFDAKPRPQGASIDIGAFEVGGASDPSPAAPTGLAIQ